MVRIHTVLRCSEDYFGGLMMVSTATTFYMHRKKAPNINTEGTKMYLNMWKAVGRYESHAGQHTFNSSRI